MFETLHIATGQLRRLLTDASRRAQAVRRWYRELGSNEGEVRGLRLLREWLSPEQLAQYDAYNYFDVRGCHSGKRYRIRHGTQTNIYELAVGFQEVVHLVRTEEAEVAKLQRFTERPDEQP